MRSRAAMTGVALVFAVSSAAAAPMTNSASRLEYTRDALSTELTRPAQKGDPALLDNLLSLRKGDGLGAADSEEGLANLRLNAMREEGHRVGSQGALHWRYKQIMSIIDRYDGQLDEAYNFGPLMIESVVLPPVIKRVTNSNRKYSDKEMRSIRVGYRLEHPARIVTMAPTWRSFLARRYPIPELPADVLLPNNGKEARVWERAVRDGWAQGVAQANRNFKISLNLLTSTYLGMLQYKLLLSQQVVSAPNLATTNLRITADGKELNIGDRIYRLTRESQFTDSSNWQPVPITPADER